MLKAVHEEEALPLQTQPPIPARRDRDPGESIRWLFGAPVWAGNRIGADRRFKLERAREEKSSIGWACNGF